MNSVKYFWISVGITLLLYMLYITLIACFLGDLNGKLTVFGALGCSGLTNLVIMPLIEKRYKNETTDN